MLPVAIHHEQTEPAGEQCLMAELGGPGKYAEAFLKTQGGRYHRTGPSRNGVPGGL